MFLDPYLNKKMIINRKMDRLRLAIGYFERNSPPYSDVALEGMRDSLRCAEQELQQLEAKRRSEYDSLERCLIKEITLRPYTAKELADKAERAERRMRELRAELYH